ncbi:uncharacterized protein BDR25DRAFT_320337 [Lindgomyces ingoldianus]|uniref:Uncharacterized protein n=1 Tax=Lindgomyces ingoldianus TaxID=673940 RepID=A0ACB6Q840_9PLEO|nr:uncharacterized protein BDR25DRAFT_320337 [Lindgomyces ingoldianus]KAF2463036.1 hypothetical protein BDR25DRAFT_320337 [Lindgomyces ingoldianus]
MASPASATMGKSNGNGGTSKMYSAQVVAALLSGLGVTSIAMKHYEMISAIDGVKTASAFQHDFRAILRNAKEYKARVDAGETFQAVQRTQKRSAAAVEGNPTTQVTPKKAKISSNGSPKDKAKANLKPTGKKGKAAAPEVK